MAQAAPDRLASRAARVEKELAELRKELAAAPKKLLGYKAPAKDAAPPEPAGPKNPYRPSDLDSVVGQSQLKRQLKIILHGARLKGTTLPNLLVAGNAGMGKTTVASLVADEIGAKMVVTTGMMLKKPEDLTALLVQQTGPCVFMCDEAHRLAPRIQESLFTIMEDGTLDLISGGESSQHKLSELVVIAATNQPGLLLEPFRARLVPLTMTTYSLEELAQIVKRVWDKRAVAFMDSETLEVAKRSRGVPRTAVSHAERVLDVMQVMGKEKIEDGDTDAALSMFNILPNGLDDVDMKILRILCKNYAGKAVGVAALAQLVTLDPTTLSETREPFLVRSGLIIRTARGRLATRAAYELLEGEGQG